MLAGTIRRRSITADRAMSDLGCRRPANHPLVGADLSLAAAKAHVLADSGWEAEPDNQLPQRDGCVDQETAAAQCSAASITRSHTGSFTS